MLIETYLPGQEFTVAILGNGDEARCLPIIGMRFDMLPQGAPPIYGYEAKWIWDTPSNPLEIYECPANILEAAGGGNTRGRAGSLSCLGMPRLVPRRCPL